METPVSRSFLLLLLFFFFVFFLRKVSILSPSRSTYPYLLKVNVGSKAQKVAAQTKSL
jgi:hypothetical protein